MVRFHAFAVSAQCVQWQRVAHILQIDKLPHLAIRITGDIHQRSLAGRRLSVAVQGNDWEQLIHRPVIEQALENRKIADVLVAHLILQFRDFLRHMLFLLAEMRHHLLANLPVQCLHLRLVFQFKHAECEHIVGVLLAIERGVIGCQFTAPRQPTANLQQLPHQRVFLFPILEPQLTGLGVSPKHLHHQHTVMCHHGPATLADDIRMWHLLGTAHPSDRLHHIVGVFLQGIIRRAFKGRPTAIVIHRQTSAHI